MDILISKYNYCVALILLLVGCYGLLVKQNLFKKVIALSIVQNAIMLFFISIAVKSGGGIPIVTPQSNGEIQPDLYANPLPHVLILTAIVVGVGTIGLALAIIQRIYRSYGTVEGPEIVVQLGKEEI